MRDSQGGARWIIGSAGALLLVLLFVAVSGIGAAGTPPTPTPIPTAAPKLAEERPAPTPTPDPVLVGQKAVDDGVERLFGEIVKPADVGAQQRLVEDYRKLRAMAQRNRLVFPTGCKVAARAYQVYAFLLAKEAFEDCYLDGQVKDGDRAELRTFATSLRNLGRNWLEHGQDDRTRYQGQTYLVLCVSVVERFALPVGECEQDLLQRVGDRSVWAPAAASPLGASR